MLEGTMKILGVDGCRAGWFMVALDSDGSWGIDIAPNLSALWNK
jgi:predicted RNase H-like nuclease